MRSLESLANDETLLVQSGRPVGIFRTHPEAPRVLLANSNLVGHWSNWDEFNRLERLGLTMYGQMTAREPSRPSPRWRASTTADRWRASWWCRAEWAEWAARSRWPPP